MSMLNQLYVKLVAPFFHFESCLILHQYFESNLDTTDSNIYDHSAYNPSNFCMILTQPRTTFKQADFFTKWLSYLSLIAKKKSQAQLHGEGSQNRPRPFSYDAHWWILDKLNFRLHMEFMVSK